MTIGRRTVDRDDKLQSRFRRVEMPAENSPPRRPGIVNKVVRDCIRWRPGALRKPVVAPDFGKMKPWRRLCETFRYKAARTEYLLSPSGTMRSWFLLWLRLAAALTIPAVVLLPLGIIMPKVITSASYFLELAVLLASLGLTIAAICFGLKLAVFLWEKFSKILNENRE